MNGLYGAEPRSDGQQGSLFWFSFPYQPDKPTARVYKIEEELTGSGISTTVPVAATGIPGDGTSSFNGEGGPNIPDPSPPVGEFICVYVSNK